MHDPADDVTWTKISRPRSRGPGSGKGAWVEYAMVLANANHTLRGLINKQSAAICALQGEVTLLRQQIAERRPKGGRAPLKEELVARVESEIEQGGADRAVARRYRISHMSVFRIRKRMQQRQKVEL
jgi:hypothetical protein